MGIKIEIKPTQERKQQIMQAAIEAMKPGKDGEKISMGDYLMISRLINAGRLNHAETLIRFKQDQSREQSIKLQQENMKLNAESAQQTEMLKAKNEMEKIKFEADQTIRIEAAKALFKIEGTSNETILRLQEQMIMNTLQPQIESNTQQMQK